MQFVTVMGRAFNEIAKERCEMDWIQNHISHLNSLSAANATGSQSATHCSWWGEREFSMANK